MKKAALALLSLVFTLLVLELAFRLIYSFKIDYQIEMSRYASLMKMDPPSPGMSHVHSPNSKAWLMGVDVTTNSQGFRDVERPVEKPRDVFRIVFLGDSMTMGWGAEAACRFSNVLERLLNAELSKSGSPLTVEVINTGVGNYNTSQEVLMYEQFGKQFKPDMVLLNYFINDAEPTPNERTSILGKHSYLYMWLWGRVNTLWRNFFSKQDYKNYYFNLYRDNEPGWESTKRAFGELAGLSRQDGFQLVMSIIPELHAVGPVYGFSEVHGQVAKAAGNAGITRVVDLAGAFANESPPTLWVSPDDAHPNCKAHAIIAQALQNYLTTNRLMGN